ncbi:MAG: hypothetical protein ACRC7O_01255 [Fimbriiglobus sp.]
MPTFPPPVPSPSAVPPPRRERRLSLRQAQVLTDLAKLAGILAFLVWVRQTGTNLQHHPPTQPPPEPLPFNVVVQRYARVHTTMAADEVFALLGPQRFEELREPEMDRHDQLVWAHPNRYPEPRYWAKWADPADPGRWVAVFVCGGRVYKTLERGVRVSGR